MGKGMDLFEQRLAAKLAAVSGVGFDPGIIIAIISALIPLIQSCFVKTPAAMRRRILNRARVANNIRKEAPNLNFVETMQLAGKVFDVADEAKDEEVQAFIDDCCA